MREELPGKQFPRVPGGTKDKHENHVFLAHGSQWKKWDNSAPGGHEAMSGDICGCHNGGAPGIEGVGPGMAAPPPKRVTRSDVRRAGPGVRGDPAVWSSDLKGLLHLYYRAKSVSAPQREKRQLNYISIYAMESFLREAGQEHHPETRLHGASPEQSRPSSETQVSLHQLDVTKQPQPKRILSL